MLGSLGPAVGDGGDVVTERRIGPVSRLVVKVGTSSLVGPDGAVSRARLARVVREVAWAAGEGLECVLVSSGAIASGLPALGLRRRPTRVPALQAAAAVGQGRLMWEYSRLFARRGIVTAQVLLTREDVERRRQFVNAQRTFAELFRRGIVPIVNENDTVATEEITFGDNDMLAALVAVLVRADLLVLLSDVDGIFTRDPRHRDARLLPELLDPRQVRVAGPGSGLASGGMQSKLLAARVAAAAGIPTVVANAARRSVLRRVLAGERVGTFVPAAGARPRARKAWLAFASSASGRIAVDAGAERALREGGKSLLPAGVVGVEGSFEEGDVVELVGPDGRVFARGRTRFSAAELLARAGTDGPRGREVVHRDDLALVSPEAS
jgi:glutamate 5-kinase